MAMHLISRDELKAQLDGSDDVRLVFALDPSAFAVAHIPGSLSFDSLEHARRVLRPDDDIVVYCSHPQCQASVIAYQQLVGHGYRRVRRYAGGLADWQAAGYPLDGTLADATDGAPLEP